MKGILANLLIKLNLDSKEFESGMGKAKKETNAFGNGMKRIGGMIAGAFAVERLISFGKELINLSGQVEGVRAAFMRMSDTATLDRLKEATSGTVSELDLMKRAVQAQNLGLPIQSLASLFEFATKRAQETGQSVDYLVDSIVLGIGRKSPLILDNLGISAIALKEKLKGVGMETASVADIAKAVGEIAADSMKRSGKIIDTNAIKIQRLSASWKDFKKQLSESQTVNTIGGGVVGALTGYLKFYESDIISWWQKILATIDVTGNIFNKGIALIQQKEEERKANDKARDSYISYMQGLAKVGSEEEKHVKTVKDLIEETDKLKESIGELGINQTAEIQRTLAQIEANEKLIDSLTTLKTKREQAFPGDVSMIKPITELPTIGESSSALGSQVTLAPEFAGITTFLEKNKKRHKELLDESLKDWVNFKNDMAAMSIDFGIDVVDQFGMAMGEMLRTGDFPDDFGNNILAAIGGFISQLGKMLIGLGIASEAFQQLLASAFTNPVSAGLLIAAGAGLVLLGGAIKGFAKAGPSGSSSGSVSAANYSGSNYGNSGTRAENNQVEFVIKGNTLVGVLNNTKRVNKNIG